MWPNCVVLNQTGRKRFAWRGLMDTLPMRTQSARTPYRYVCVCCRLITKREQTVAKLPYVSLPLYSYHRYEAHAVKKAVIALASRCAHECLLRIVSSACEMPRLADGHGCAVKNASTSEAASAVLNPLTGTVAMRVVSMPADVKATQTLCRLA